MAQTAPRKPPLRSDTMSSLSPPLICFTNCLICLHGELLPQDLYFSPETGLITPNYYFRAENVERVDMGGQIIAPGFIDLQTNGMAGIHFTNLASTPSNTTFTEDSETDEQKLTRIANMELSAGVTAFYATLPTVPSNRWAEILPTLQPRSFPHGADLLGAHVEGPFLAPAKKGAHDSSFFQSPTDVSPSKIYGDTNLTESIKMITLAPELPGSVTLIGHLQETYPHITVSMGHSSGTYTDGLAAIDVGAKALTHTFNAMPPLHHRDPGLAGLISSGKLWYSVIADGIHVHPSLLTTCLRTNPQKCILITDSIELAGLPDGLHRGHGQIKGLQRKTGNRVTLEGTDTLVGSCITLDECVRNMVGFTGCGIAEAVRCVTENVAELMGESCRGRGMLEAGRRADLVVLGAEGWVRETWILGRRVWKAAGTREMAG